MKKTRRVRFTELEYQNIKDIMVKMPNIENKGIAELFKRSTTSIRLIRKSKSFEDYQELRIIKQQPSWKSYIKDPAPPEVKFSQIEQAEELKQKIEVAMEESKESKSIIEAVIELNNRVLKLLETLKEKKGGA